MCFHFNVKFIFVAKDFGMFQPDEDPRKGIWLEPGRTLEYYLLKTGVRKAISLILIQLSSSLL